MGGVVVTMRLAALLAMSSFSVALVTPAFAGANISFEIYDVEHRTGFWDQQVLTAVAGCRTDAACRERARGIEVYLRRGPVRRAAVSRLALRAVGRVDGRGRLRFRMPRVEAGPYHLVVEAAPGGAGRWRPASGTFQVVEPAAHVVATCRRHSLARFPDAFSDPRNVVVGPLVLVGAAFTDARTIREHGGNKFPALVEAGHRVTVEVPPEHRASSRLGYGGLSLDGQIALLGAPATVTFVACPPGKRPDSSAGSRQVTFWSGGVATRSPRCLPLDVRVDGSPTARRVFVGLGRRCP